MGVEKALVRGLSILLMLLLSWSFSQAQDANETQIVRGRGAILHGDQSKARKRAIASSLRQALEQTVAELLAPNASVSHLQVLKEQIYRRAPRYVRSYRMLWEYPDLPQKVYRVELEVEVAVKAVVQAISRLGVEQVN
ncbi:hypothetical protein C2W62_06345 [Candidatus Entotheonella serta]|nr:hypothetical protein C2W62_06345 [Candidatus Entotheonella serta]